MAPSFNVSTLENIFSTIDGDFVYTILTIDQSNPINVHLSKSRHVGIVNITPLELFKWFCDLQAQWLKTVFKDTRSLAKFTSYKITQSLIG